ncbi:MAG: 2-oxoglutarate dehydrogenase E1 component [Spirochaetaceae bacterium]|nr:MAG: 2-oxoglutarate dehydrogenase E1 component [Spirochaetaceae bacterium]
MVNSEDLSLMRSDYLEELYEMWSSDPTSVDPPWRDYFSHLESEGATRPAIEGRANKRMPSSSVDGRDFTEFRGPSPSGVSESDPGFYQGRVNALIWGYRDIGYIYARLNPLQQYTTPELDYMYYTMEGNFESLDLAAFGLSDAPADQDFSTGRYIKPARMKLQDLISKLSDIYCGSTGYEFLHIQNKPMRRWLIEKIEGASSETRWDTEHKVRFQKDLIKAEEFEHFVQNNFIGQKRFSLEGGEVLIPALHYAVYSAARHGLQEIVLGMAHRGRLNVFTNVLRKPAAETFSMFIDNYQAHAYGGSGDVKYHLGHSFDWENNDGDKIHISLVANPSHLESVNPVVEGKCRGIQRRRNDNNRKKVMPILVHGDAAFSGQGVVAETLNLSQLKGYRTGGTVHIILNNQIGFTTASRDARSTFFATDIAKSMPVPIIHVNGDDPEAVINAIDLAMRYRQKFSYDAVVDIFCYRRLGHNEADEPSFTHPLMYNTIKEHDSTAAIYGETLNEPEVFPLEKQKAFKEKYRNVLKLQLEKAKSPDWAPSVNDSFQGGEWQQFTTKYSFDPVTTAVGHDTLEHITQALVGYPADFNPHPKLQRLLTQRQEVFDSGEGLDWAFCESLAFGTLLLEGHALRLSGEDCGRGTFSQRHAVWWDVASAKPRSYVPLRNLGPEQGWFSVFDSPLSEFSVLGFDYGYSLVQPNILVMWEAQFGDFVNGAQVIIDQFIASGESKWFRSSGLVMLLPHGYEGQGPEHSSAHLERFLQLCGDDNLQVVNMTEPAQYFHALRRQIHQPFRKPLIVMAPKSLLRHKEAVSSVQDLTEGGFQHILDDPKGPTDAKRVLFCSGKVYYDLDAYREKQGITDTAIIRIEQIYPFHREQFREVVAHYSKAEVYKWVQEETQNRGAWTFIQPYLLEALELVSIPYVGRPRRPSPAAGSFRKHSLELDKFLGEAFSEEINDA